MSKLFELASELKRLAVSSDKFKESYPALTAVIKDAELVIDSCSKGSTRGCAMGCIGS